jgi:hypothetical protein
MNHQAAVKIAKRLPLYPAPRRDPTGRAKMQPEAFDYLNRVNVAIEMK